MLIAGRPGLWDDWVAFQKMYAQREMAAERARILAEREAKEQQEELILAACILILFSIFAMIIFGFVYVVTR
jgi:fatty acid desaturase